MTSVIFKQFQGVQGASWAELAERLARYGHWEFEDYQAFIGDAEHGSDGRHGIDNGRNGA